MQMLMQMLMQSAGGLPLGPAQCLHRRCSYSRHVFAFSSLSLRLRLRKLASETEAWP